MTFSIIGIDPEREMIGSAVASRWTGVAGCVQYFRHGVGFVNLQNHSYAQVAYRVLDAMESDDDLERCVETALDIDTASHLRQMIVCSLKTKEFYVYSGAGCTGIHVHKVSEHCAAAGNTLTDEAVIDAMITTYEGAAGEPITERLIRALEAGQAAGGDARGQEAAGVKAYNYSYPVQRFYPIDLRVDHDDAPLKVLRKLYTIFGENDRRYEIE